MLTKDEIRKLAKTCILDDGTWIGSSQDAFVNGFTLGQENILNWNRKCEPLMDEHHYNIMLKDNTKVENVEYWAFGGGFGALTKKEIDARKAGGGSGSKE